MTDEQHFLAKASQELCELFLLNNAFIKRLINDALALEDVKIALRVGAFSVFFCLFFVFCLCFFSV